MWSLSNGVRANSRTEPTAVPAAAYHLCLLPFRAEKGEPAIQAFIKCTEVAHCDLDSLLWVILVAGP